MSISSGTPNTVSLQKNNALPPELPPVDEYGKLLPQLLAEPRSGSAGWGISWITNAFALFKEQFLLWIGMVVVYLIIMAVTSAIPVINLIFSIISFVFIGGIIKGCAAQVSGKELRFNHLFSAFGTHSGPLIILFLLYVVALIIAIVPAGIIFVALAHVLSSSDSINSVLSVDQISNGTIIALLLASLVAILIFIPLSMAVWFAPALIVLHDIRPIESMKMSLKGCLKNIGPLFVFFLVGPIIALLVFTLTLGIGMLVLVPIGMITYYTSYRDVWTDQPLSATT